MCPKAVEEPLANSSVDASFPSELPLERVWTIARLEDEDV
jgi:hypothetical protein